MRRGTVQLALSPLSRKGVGRKRQMGRTWHAVRNAFDERPALLIRNTHASTLPSTCEDCDASGNMQSLVARARKFTKERKDETRETKRAHGTPKQQRAIRGEETGRRIQE